MKLRAVYYIDEPKDLTSDTFEVGILTEPEPGEEGGYEYALRAITIKYINDWMARHNVSYFCQGRSAPLLVVPDLADATIIAAIEDLLPQIDKVALRVE